MICKNCNFGMRLDDVDYNFKGNQDNYYLCDNCDSAYYEKIRFDKIVSAEWIGCDDD